MTFQLNKSQKAIQKSVLDFTKGEFDKDTIREFDKRAEFPTDIWKKAADLGFVGIHLPEKYSGGGLGWLENVMVAETFAAKDSTIGSAVMLTSVAAEWLARFGSEEQKERLLPELLEGRKQPAVLISQPAVNHQNGNALMEEAGSGGTWQISGTVDNMINARKADILLMLCRDAEKVHEVGGFNMLAMEIANTGIDIEKDHDILGLRMTGMARLKLDNVEVSHVNLVGKRHRGLIQFQQVLPEMRMLLAGLALGTAQGAFDRALAYIKEREQFGRKVAEFQVTRHKLAHIALQIEQARCLVYQAASQIGHGKQNGKMTSMASLAATRAGVDVSYEAIQLLGGYGYTTEYDVERCYRDAKTLQILSGYANDLIEDIAAAVIGRIKK